MSKLVIIGDIHGRTIWKEIIKKESPDKVVFMGDYFDSFDIPVLEQIHNFKEIVNLKKENPNNVVLLYGNHDHHYMKSGDKSSGFSYMFQHDIYEILSKAVKNKHVQISSIVNDLLFVHAGVSTVWLKNHLPEIDVDIPLEQLSEELNKVLWEGNIRMFNFVGLDPYGNSQESSPIWIRMNALLRSNKKEEIKKTFRQVVGHTAIDEINLNHQDKIYGGRYYMCDALGVRQYLVYDIDKDVLSVGKI